MDFQTLAAEVQAEAGIKTPLTAPRAKRYVNQAYLEVCDRMPWPFLEVSVQQAAPMTISDARLVLWAADATNSLTLEGRSLSWLRANGLILETTGNPVYWYWQGSTSLRTYPVSTSAQIGVRYIKVPTELSADADEPLVPARYHDVIVHGAVDRAATAAGEFDRAQAARQAFDRRIGDMIVGLLMRSTSPDPSIVAYATDS